MKKNELEQKFKTGEYDNRLKEIYGENLIDFQKKRILDLADRFKVEAETEDFTLFSTAGRTELMGNHTDHNHGCVLCASVQLDTLACACKRDDSIIAILSKGYPQAIINLNELDKNPDEVGTTEAIIRGIAARFKQLGYKIGGYTAVTTSSVPGGSGLSSSAAVEILIGTILNYFYNEGVIDPVELAKIGQWSENNYFDKPCGLMDQVACGYGGIVRIDFMNPAAPEIESVHFDFEKAGYSLMVVNTGGSHADLTDEYAAVPKEMKTVARFFGQEVLRGISKEQLMNKASEIRQECGDRCFLRALHFINENNRPASAVEALKEEKITDYLKLVEASGQSSWDYLQNCTSIKDVNHQGVTTALALSKELLGDAGTFRVHGGGFAGTIQAYVPKEKAAFYKETMEKYFGEGSVTPLRIRQISTTQLF